MAAITPNTQDQSKRRVAYYYDCKLEEDERDRMKEERLLER